jgi:adenylate kinase family enzyme
MESCEYVLKLINKGKFVDEWLKTKYKEKPIIIYGNPGTGKTTLANYILKDHTIIHINIEFCKQKQTLEEYLGMSLYKKSIKMMFSKTNIYKSLLIDDINYIQTNDKTLFKSIINFSKIHHEKHPTIFIFNTIKHKSIQGIYKKSFPINLSYSEEQYKQLTKKYFITNKESTDLTTLIEKSNHNFHNIKINLDFYKKDVQLIHNYDKVESELDLSIKTLFTKDIKNIYDSSYSDYLVIGLNILENCIHWIFKSELPYNEKIRLIDLIYTNNYLGDILLTKIHIYLDWGLTEHLITNIIVIPIIILRNNNIKMLEMNYNKYISKCIIYTHNRKLLDLNELNYEILNVLYHYINNYIISDITKKEQIKDYIMRYLQYHRIPLKIVEKFSRFYLPQIKRHYFKLFKD